MSHPDDRSGHLPSTMPGEMPLDERIQRAIESADNVGIYPRKVVSLLPDEWQTIISALQRQREQPIYEASHIMPGKYVQWTETPCEQCGKTIILTAKPVDLPVDIVESTEWLEALAKGAEFDDDPDCAVRARKAASALESLSAQVAEYRSWLEREGIDIDGTKKADAELERIFNMTDEEVRASLIAEGINPEIAAENTKYAISQVIKLVQLRKRAEAAEKALAENQSGSDILMLEGKLLSKKQECAELQQAYLVEKGLKEDALKLLADSEAKRQAAEKDAERLRSFYEAWNVCDNTRGKYSCVAEHDSRCANQFKKTGQCVCGATELAIAAAAIDAARKGDKA